MGYMDRIPEVVPFSKRLDKPSTVKVVEGPYSPLEEEIKKRKIETNKLESVKVEEAPSPHDSDDFDDSFMFVRICKKQKVQALCYTDEEDERNGEDEGKGKPTTKFKDAIIEDSPKKGYCTESGEKKIQVENQQINYLKTGVGEHNVLCLPGSLGTIWTDFGAQIASFDLNKFTLIVWDPPGYGKSRPPNRTFPPNFLELDADFAVKLLKTLNVSKCSLLGWSDGGITALFMAAKYPEVVDKLVVWGANAYFTDEDIEAYEKIRNISQWSKGMRNAMSNIYGMEELQKMMNEWVDACIRIRKNSDGNLCVDLLPKITAKTMILHGEQDPLVPTFHAQFLKKNIKNSELHLLQDGKHNIHSKFAELFNQLVQAFLLQK